MKNTKRLNRLSSWLKHLHDQVKKSNSGSKEIESSVLTMCEIQNRINIFKKLQ